MLSHISFTTGVLLCSLVFSGVAAEKCITCKRDTLEACVDGEEAAEFDDQKQECSASLPFCEVTVTEGPKSVEPGAEPELELRDVSRGCIQQERFTCDTVDDVRTCTATCQGDLCNDFEDVADRVAEYERQKKEEEDAATPGWVIPVAVVAAVVGIAALAAGILFTVRSQANRRKARRLKMNGESDEPLKA